MPLGNLRSTSTLRRLRRIYFVGHGFSLGLGIGLILVAGITERVDRETVKNVGLVSTGPAQVVFYVAGGGLILASVIGVSALLKDNMPYLWVIYCMLMAVLCLTVIVGSLSSLTHQVGHLEKKLNESISGFQDDSRANKAWRKVPAAVELVEMVNKIQEEHNCCGLNSYKDWQDVEFGRTSLKVPLSCCKLVNPATGQKLTERLVTSLSAELQDAYKYCGHLMLPTHPNLEINIHTRGCFSVLTKDLYTTITVMGVYGVCVAILIAISFTGSCYLVVTKRV